MLYDGNREALLCLNRPAVARPAGACLLRPNFDVPAAALGEKLSPNVSSKSAMVSAAMKASPTPAPPGASEPPAAPQFPQARQQAPRPQASEPEPQFRSPPKMPG